MPEMNTFENIRFANDYPFSFSDENHIQTFPLHWHNFAEMIIAKNDSLQYRIDNQTFHMKKGDVLFIHPCELHALVHNEDRENSFMLLQFNYSLLMNLPSFRKYRYLFRQFAHLRYDSHPVLAQNIYRYQNEMCELYRNRQDDFTDVAICSVFYRMFSEIGAYLSSDITAEELVTSNSTSVDEISKRIVHQSQLSPKMMGVCAYITQHCAENPTLDEAALYAGFSRFHFSRLFREFTGTSYVEFLAQAKLNLATQLLAEPSLTITDVALQSGFGSLSTFNRCFQRYRNTTPTHFRAQYLKNEFHTVMQE